MNTSTTHMTTTLGKTVDTAAGALYATHHQILIIGAGTAGIPMAALLHRKLRHSDIAILDPSESHYYQPAWTLVGAGAYDKLDTVRPMAEVIPDGVSWIREAASQILPEKNLVITQTGRAYSYEYLIVAPGLQINWDLIPGLVEGIGTQGICSNYSYRHVDYTWECIRGLRGGRAIFTNPATPIKCGGAPQKIMYLASDHWKRSGTLKGTEVLFNSAGGIIFGVPQFAETLKKVIADYGIQTNFLHNLVEIRPDRKEADFDILKDGKPVDRKTFTYDMLHVTPPMGAPDFIKASPLANEAGWVDVDHGTLRHNRYANVFSLGDAAGTPNAKTGAAIRKQAGILAHNLMQIIRDGELKTPQIYTGYSSCPLITGYGKVVLAEFDYKNQPMPSFPFNQAKQRFSMYLLKKYALPAMYWRAMLNGYL